MSKDSSKPKKEDFGSPLKVLINTITIFLVSQFMAVLIALLGLRILHPSGMVNLDGSTGGQFVYILVAESLAIGLVWSIIKKRNLNLASVGLGRLPSRPDILKGLLGFGVFYVVIIIVTLVINVLLPEVNFDQQQSVGFTNLGGTIGPILAFIALVLLPPLGEETLVRGYLYSGLRSTWKFWPAAIVTSVLFGLAHLQGGDNNSLIWAATIDTFVLSMVLVYLRESTGALYAGILLHSLNNLVAFSVHFHGVLF